MNKRITVRPACFGAALILALSILPRCRGEKTYAVEVRDGVRYVHNIKPASEKPVARLVFVGKIGELESKDPDRQFVRPMSADEDAAGNLFILDDKDSCVKKFNARREYVGRFGRKGQGPGEFQYGMKVGVSASGQVVVSTMSSEFHVFGNDGSYVDRFRLPRYRGSARSSSARTASPPTPSRSMGRTTGTTISWPSSISRARSSRSSASLIFWTRRGGPGTPIS
ncbi:MAG: hypothetical protein JW775_12410 [Candidatus Aminicenantes bacterium]|nr:hypothetical protein [Candidatus Aminicenantes bacterium]